MQWLLFEEIFARHAKRCMSDLASKPQALPVNFLSAHSDDQICEDYRANVLINSTTSQQ